MSDKKKISLEEFKNFVLQTVRDNLSNLHPEEDKRIVQKIVSTYEKAVSKDEA